MFWDTYLHIVYIVYILVHYIGTPCVDYITLKLLFAIYKKFEKTAISV